MMLGPSELSAEPANTASLSSEWGEGGVVHRGLAQELIWQGGKWVLGCLAPRAVAFASFCASLFSIFLTSVMSPCFKNT